ncbi:hypothetical protein GX48_05037 [Paracoccidioides brasiliensis]|nr:hypothetical protein GX48_05037 [Paracoccidioides brasiliensis]
MEEIEMFFGIKITKSLTWGLAHHGHKCQTNFHPTISPAHLSRPPSNVANSVPHPLALRTLKHLVSKCQKFTGLIRARTIDRCSIFRTTTKASASRILHVDHPSVHAPATSPPF